MTEELDRVLQTRGGRRVEYLSITWTSLEAIIALRSEYSPEASL